MYYTLDIEEVLTKNSFGWRSVFVSAYSLNPKGRFTPKLYFYVPFYIYLYYAHLKPREPREVNWGATWMEKVAAPGLENRD